MPRFPLEDDKVVSSLHFPFSTPVLPLALLSCTVMKRRDVQWVLCSEHSHVIPCALGVNVNTLLVSLCMLCSHTSLSSEMHASTWSPAQHRHVSAKEHLFNLSAFALWCIVVFYSLLAPTSFTINCMTAKTCFVCNILVLIVWLFLLRASSPSASWVQLSLCDTVFNY